MNTDEDAYRPVNPEELKQAWTFWIHGHHLIHIELAWMTDLLRRAKQRFDSGDTDGGELLMARFRRLLAASGAAMRYAANLREEIYVHYIRPAMPPGDFSGVYNIEHRAMQQALGDIKRCYKGGKANISGGCPFAKFKKKNNNTLDPEDLHQLSQAPGELGILAAEVIALEDHGFVCRGMVSDRPSMMDETSKEYNEQTQAGWQKLLSRLKLKMSKLSQGIGHDS